MRYAYSAPTVPLKQEKICKRLKYSKLDEFNQFKWTVFNEGDETNKIYFYNEEYAELK